MDAAKEIFLRKMYGDRAVDAMKAKIAAFGKSLTDEKEFADDLLTGFKQEIAAIVRDATGDPMPFGGATSWAELDAFLAAADQADRMSDVLAQHAAMEATIFATMPPAQQAAALSALAAGLDARFQLAAAVKAVRSDPVMPFLAMISPGASQFVVAGTKARRAAPDLLDLITAPARGGKSFDPWKFAGYPAGGAR